jgi:hypothetical protein
MFHRTAYCCAFALSVVFAATVSGQTPDQRFGTMRARALGMTLFADHCASCHGRSGQGDGPRAKELKRLPSNLTRLAEHNGWTFPADRVARLIAGAEHTSLGGEVASKEQVEALTLYLEFIQLRRTYRQRPYHKNAWHARAGTAQRFRAFLRRSPRRHRARRAPDQHHAPLALAHVAANMVAPRTTRAREPAKRSSWSFSQRLVNN